jgi:hypothetical protein
MKPPRLCQRSKFVRTNVSISQYVPSSETVGQLVAELTVVLGVSETLDVAGHCGAGVDVDFDGHPLFLPLLKSSSSKFPKKLRFSGLTVVAGAVTWAEAEETASAAT